MSPLRYLIVLLLLTVFGTLAVAQQARVFHLGHRVVQLRDKRALLAEDSCLLQCEISALSNPVRIAGEVERLNIGLLNPVELTQASVNVGPGEHLARGRIASH
jgi:hypothetical protein